MTLHGRWQAQRRSANCSPVANHSRFDASKEEKVAELQQRLLVECKMEPLGQKVMRLNASYGSAVVLRDWLRTGWCRWQQVVQPLKHGHGCRIATMCTMVVLWRICGVTYPGKVNGSDISEKRGIRPGSDANQSSCSWQVVRHSRRRTGHPIQTQRFTMAFWQTGEVMWCTGRTEAR